MIYAEQTTVSSERSRAEIESTLGRYGATSFAYMWQGLTTCLMAIFGVLLEVDYKQKITELTEELKEK